MMRRAAIFLSFPVVLSAQETQKCSWSAERQTNVKSPSGQYNSFLGGNVLMRCPAKEVTLRSDSLESYADEGRVYVIGHVRYNEPRLDLDSDFLNYYQKDERIIAQGNVFARLPNGSTMRGPVAEYQRVIPGVRLVPRLIATGRPTIGIVQKDSTGKATDTTTVLANNVTMVGDSLVYAGGAVLVTQKEVTARGDSMALDSERETTVMMRGPSIEGRRGRPFTLAGGRIELTGRNRKLERVVAKGRATAVSEDMTLASDTIELHIADDLLQRTIAWGPAPGRASASSPTQKIISDSIDVLMPAQKIREMHAVRRAVAEGKPDTTRFRADTVDWMRGDTIVARFDTTVTRDTSRSAKLRELLAVGNAKSYYHLPASDSTLRKPAINYVTGREILVDFQDQRVAKVTVFEKAAGVYLEPKPEAAKPDTTRATAVPPPAQAPASTPPPAPRPPPRRPPLELSSSATSANFRVFRAQ